MKAINCVSFGPPETLELQEVAEPVAGDGEVVIEVKAASLNFFDTLIIEGKYQFRPEPPFSPSSEIAGVVESIGSGVSGIEPGDRVIAYMGWGGTREKILAKPEQIAKIPDEIGFSQAAGLTVTYGTTLHALKDRANIQPGETLAILGASGGVGQAAIEIGKVMGAEVIACASSDDKLAFCKELGADHLLNYAQKDLKDELKRLTDGKGVDVVYDAVGAGYSEAALRATGWNGRFLVIGFAAGEIARIPLNLALLKGCSIVGVFWGDHIRREPDKHQANMQTLVDWCAAGKISPHIWKEYPLEQTAEALLALARREVKGKAVVVP